MKNFGIVVAMFLMAGIAAAVAVNPTSNVLADSANTASSIVYRDSNGAFSAGAITATSITNTGQILLQVATTTQLVTIVPSAVGALISVQLLTSGSPGSSFTLCEGSGTAAGQWIYPSTATVVPARACN